MPLTGGSEFSSRRSRHSRIAQWQSAVPTRRRGPGRYGVRLPCACRSTDRTSDYESEDRGSSPRGRTFARLAQWESTWPTPRGHRGSIPSRSTGARTQLVAGLGCDPRSTGFDSRLAPQGRAVHWRDMRPVKSWLRLWEFESLPAHASPWQRILPPRFRTLAAQFDSGQGHQTAHSARDSMAPS